MLINQAQPWYLC